MNWFVTRKFRRTEPELRMIAYQAGEYLANKILWDVKQGTNPILPFVKQEQMVEILRDNKIVLAFTDRGYVVKLGFEIALNRLIYLLSAVPTDLEKHGVEYGAPKDEQTL
jgi:hypothetical protein